MQRFVSDTNVEGPKAWRYKTKMAILRCRSVCRGLVDQFQDLKKRKSLDEKNEHEEHATPVKCY